MIGPSSSHTAGAVSIALLARKMFPEEVKKVTFTLYALSPKLTTDMELTARCWGNSRFFYHDERIRDAFSIATERGVEYEYIIDEKTMTNHPNTADIDLVGVTGHTLSIRGESIGGGKMKIVRINQIDVEFTGEYSTLIVSQTDKPGVVAHITQCLSEENVNIAFMRLFREDKGANAFTVVESDETIPSSVLDKIKTHEHVSDLMLIQM